MTPYTKKIVELHKIHKAIEEKDCCNGGGNTPSGDIGYEEIYQFYKKQIIENTQQGVLDTYVIPETFNDIKSFYGYLYEHGKIGIWFCDYNILQELSSPMLLFTTFNDNNMPDKCIFLGQYVTAGK